jgi:flagellar biosynthesis/type III secretory pathway protein FliH
VTISLSSVIRGYQQTDNGHLGSLVIPVPRVELANPATELVAAAKELAASAEVETEDIRLAAKAVADELIANAQREADRVLAEARRESERLQIEAQAAGLAEGQAVGRAEYEVLSNQLHEEHQQRMEEVTRLALQIQSAREQVVKSTVQPLPAICMEVLRDLLQRELELAPANIEAIVQELLQYVLESTRLEIRVNPVDYALAQAAHPVWRAAKYGEWELIVIPDGTISPGGCHLRSDVGTIDGTLETKLEVLQEAIDKAFAGGEVTQVDSVSDVRSLG